MFRRLFTLASVLSLLLCAATVVMWVRSYLRPETFVWERIDSLSWHRTGERSDLDADAPDGPTADLTMELSLYPGGMRLWRERMLGTTREIALDGDHKPSRVSAPGWHFAGTFAATDREVMLIGEGGVFGGTRLGFSQYLDSQEAPLWQFQRGPAGFPRSEMVTSVSCGFWILFALTLVCPGYWVVRRGLASYLPGSRRQLSEGDDIRARAGGSSERRVRRSLVFASVLSLLLCVATVRFWVRSYRQQSELECLYQWTRGPRLLDATLLAGFTRGELLITLGGGNAPHQDFKTLGPDVVEWASFSPPNQSVDLQWRRTGFGWHREHDSNDAPDPNVREEFSAWTLLAPLWFVVLVLSVLPLYLLARIVRSRRQTLRLSRNLCVECGYDLRASPDRCPECGRSTTSPIGATK